MFAYLKGIYTLDLDAAIALECGGVGFAIAISETTRRKMPRKGEEVLLHTYLHLREDVMDLYGFFDEPERFQFKQLIAVSGVGPKVALGILSHLTPEQLATSVVSGDAKALTVCPGVGPKLAQRLVLELKDKISDEMLLGASAQAGAGAPGTPRAGSDVISALLALGYSQSEAALALRNVDTSGLSLEQSIKAALRQLMKETR